MRTWNGEKLAEEIFKLAEREGGLLKDSLQDLCGKALKEHAERKPGVMYHTVSPTLLPWRMRDGDGP